MSENENCDRAADFSLVWEGEIFDGYGLCPVEVEATEDGLMVDARMVVPWNWVRQAMARIAKPCEEQAEGES